MLAFVEYGADLHYQYSQVHFDLDKEYHNSSVWLDTRDGSSCNRNPADFILVGYLTIDVSSISA